LWLLSAGIIMMLAAGCGGGGTSTGSLSGSIDGYIMVPAGLNQIVASAQGPPRTGYSPLAGATVTVGTASKITDANGYYQITGLPAGYQTVEVTKAGYLPTQFTVSVVANRITRVPTSDRTRWTVLIYMNGDNDLEPAAILNMNQMEEAGSNRDVNIVVQIDRSPGFDSSNGDWTDTRRYLITRDQDAHIIHSTLLEDRGELDMGVPETLRDFIQWGLASYPADHTMLVLWDHGRGWRTARTRERKLRAISYDQTSGTNLSLGELTAALDVGEKLDVVAFDACLMGMAEVAYAIKDEARWMVGSEENVPFEGQPYQDFLSALVASPEMTPEQLGRAMVDFYIAHYGPGSLTTESVIDLSRTEALAARIGTFGQELRAIRDSYGAMLDEIRRATQHYDIGADIYADYKDLGDYTVRIAGADLPTGVKTAARQVTDALSEAVIYQKNAGGAVQNSHGLAIYLPDRSSYLSEYSGLSFARDTGWNLFLSP